MYRIKGLDWQGYDFLGQWSWVIRGLAELPDANRSTSMNNPANLINPVNHSPIEVQTSFKSLKFHVTHYLT